MNMNKEELLQHLEELECSIPALNAKRTDYQSYFVKFTNLMVEVVIGAGTTHLYLTKQSGDIWCGTLFSGGYRHPEVSAPVGLDAILVQRFHLHEGLKDFFVLLRKHIESSSHTVVYEAARNENTCEILINGKRLAKPHSGSSADILSIFLFDQKNQNRVVKVGEEEALQPIRENLTKLITELKFTGDTRKVFFGSSSNKSFEFCNPITEEYIRQQKLPRLKDFEKRTTAHRGIESEKVEAKSK